MRIGLNPHKDQFIVATDYLHQVVMPVYIPNLEGYFANSLTILQLSLESLLKTIHDKTFVTIVNNGSCNEVVAYLNQLKEENKIHELIHTTNIGKVNAILKGITGNNIELVTITDADVLFCEDWQLETAKVFQKIPQVGVVGIVPQFCNFKVNAENVLLANLLNKRVKFLPVKNREALIRFYDSIGWDRSYNKEYLKYTLGLEYDVDCKVIIGAGHFVSTYKRTIFDEVNTFVPYKLGGNSEDYIDRLPLLRDYWRVTTYDNYAYHMGNTPEDWMFDKLKTMHKKGHNDYCCNFLTSKSKNSKWIVFRNKVFRKLILNKTVLPFLYAKWGLPNESVKEF
ncbi:glycosyltransferase family A protein [Flavobacterium chuncheonense]|uniref:Glycosyltransferase family A protein n=1 Tax=Flavobacterium chuncheonense TaxID=2026653 RepID=A0ABW5YIU9_9FLAO